MRKRYKETYISYFFVAWTTQINYAKETAIISHADTQKSGLREITESYFFVF